MSRAYIFPGQGSQYVGMGMDLYENFAEAKEVYHKASQISGIDIAGISFEGSAEDLAQTQFTQPAIFTHSWALMEILGYRANGELAAGHSLGEYSALCASNVISYEDGIKAVTLRGELMSRAEDGGMLAPLGADLQACEDVAAHLSEEGIMTVANYNAPGQFILSGEKGLLAKAAEMLKERGAKRVAELTVSGAFHSPLMEVATEELAEFLSRIKFRPATMKFFSNVTGDLLLDPDEIKENLIKQLTHPVRWIDIVENMIKAGAEDFTEIGPGKVLRGLIKRIDRNVELSGFDKIDDFKELL